MSAVYGFSHVPIESGSGYSRLPGCPGLCRALVSALCVLGQLCGSYEEVYDLQCLGNGFLCVDLAACRSPMVPIHARWICVDSRVLCLGRHNLFVGRELFWLYLGSRHLCVLVVGTSDRSSPSKGGSLIDTKEVGWTGIVHPWGARAEQAGPGQAAKGSQPRGRHEDPKGDRQGGCLRDRRNNAAPGTRWTRWHDGVTQGRTAIVGHFGAGSSKWSVDVLWVQPGSRVC